MTRPLSRPARLVRGVAIVAGASAFFSAGLLLPAPSQGEYERARQTVPAVYPVTVYEDGSARMSDGSTRPEDTYPWNCATMGNRKCGR